MGSKLCQLKTQIWFEDEKCTKLNVLSPFLISNTHTAFSVVLRRSKQKRKLLLYRCFYVFFPSSQDVLSKVSKLHKLIFLQLD